MTEKRQLFSCGCEPWDEFRCKYREARLEIDTLRAALAESEAKRASVDADLEKAFDRWHAAESEARTLREALEFVLREEEFQLGKASIEMIEQALKPAEKGG